MSLIAFGKHRQNRSGVKTASRARAAEVNTCEEDRSTIQSVSRVRFKEKNLTVTPYTTQAFSPCRGTELC